MDKDMRRILLKFIVLKTISDQSTYGYEIIHRIEKITGGRWTPSAGSIYPILEGLETNGYIRSEEIERKKVYSITPQGMKMLDRMIQKRMEFLREMTLIINNVLGDDSILVAADSRSPGLPADPDDGRVQKNESGR